MAAPPSESTEANAALEELLDRPEPFCVGQLVKLVQDGPYKNRLALVLAAACDGVLKVRLFEENVSRVRRRA
jgi:hypothetical protein